MPFSSVLGAQSIVKPGVCTSTTRPAVPYDGQVVYLTDTDQTIVWDGTQWTVLAPIAGGRNMVINGAMDVWQRGASFANASASPYYTADRWQTYRATGNAGMTASRQTSALEGFTYALRVQRDSGNTSLTDIIVAQSFETQNVRKYHNKLTTLSFYARCGANFSSTSSLLSCAISSGTGTDGSIANGLTGQTDNVFLNVALTTTFQRFTVSLSSVLVASRTQLAVRFAYTPVGTAGANDWVEITGVQLEASAVATPFEFEDYQVTLAKCQRYFNRAIDFSADNGGTATQHAIMVGQNFGSTGGYGAFVYPRMRISPVITFSGQADFIAAGAGGNNIATTAIVANAIKPTSCELRYTVASGLTAGQASFIYTTASSGKIDLSAEL